MAIFNKHSENFNIEDVVKINLHEKRDKFTIYTIEIYLGPYKWTVRRRFSEFSDLHRCLASKHSLSKDLLPPKKIIGNQSEAFVKQRKSDLEVYLRVVLEHFDVLPYSLAHFLDFNLYEIHFITQDMAEYLFYKGDELLNSQKLFVTSPLQLHAITERIKLAEPPCESGDKKRDIGHILDFLSQVRHLKIEGRYGLVGSSSIAMNELEFDLSLFKNLEELELSQCNPLRIHGLESLKRTLQKLSVRNSVETLKKQHGGVPASGTSGAMLDRCSTVQLQDILLQDVDHITTERETMLVRTWNRVVSAELSFNSIQKIDESIKLLCAVECLDLSHNLLEDIQELQFLTSLTSLNLSHNHMTSLSDFHLRLGNIRTLDLSHNHVRCLDGLGRLYSLVNLNLSNNEVSRIVEIKPLGSLPCLENLNLQRNPVTKVLDYRTKVLELFGDRAGDIWLDQQAPTGKELDTVNVLVALRKARDSKSSFSQSIPSSSSLNNDSASCSEDTASNSASQN